MKIKELEIEEARRAALVFLRALWVGFLMVDVALGIVGLLRIEWDSFPMPWIAWGLTALLVLSGFFGRNQIYKKYWQGRVVTPRGYLLGNGLLFIALLFVTFASAMALMRGMVVIGFVGLIVALFLQVVNFPTGKPMRPGSVE